MVSLFCKRSSLGEMCSCSKTVRTKDMNEETREMKRECNKASMKFPVKGFLDSRSPLFNMNHKHCNVTSHKNTIYINDLKSL